MKILISFSDRAHLAPFFEAISCVEGALSCDYKHMHFDFCETGSTLFETAYHLGIALQKQRYHLVLFVGLANSLNKNMLVGDVLNVIKEIPFKMGEYSNNAFESLYDLKLLDSTRFPHQRAGFINMTNSYFNVFLPLMKTASICTPLLGGDLQTVKEKIEHYPIHIESSNGLAVQYAFLYCRMPFYQLRAIKKNLYLNNEDESLALIKLNEELIRIIELL